MKNVIDESAVIVGASLSGLMTGIALARAGLHVTIWRKLGRIDVVEVGFKLMTGYLIGRKPQNS